jgi:hypothetical protein
MVNHAREWIIVFSILSFVSAIFYIAHRYVWALDSPYPPSPAITSIEWDSPSSIVRKATGSDGWAIAWGPDDKLYAAYADGRGFVPKLREKLSLGFAIVEGNPPDIRGRNLRSVTGERTGSGRRGMKARGMLFSDGSAYMLVRNADLDGQGCQLAVSADRMETWLWMEWIFEEFGYCTFLDRGKGVPLAKDQYVYIYAHDGESAYEAADSFVLMRVPNSRITHRESYEFFAGLSPDQSPRWDDEVSNRAAVFEHPGNSLRSGISYNRAIDRYIWWQQIGREGSDTRFKGGFGIFDAPEPWGPWTTVYFQEAWDVGPGESGRFPTKWMSADGKTMYLVFSGDDSFSVRKAMLTINASH